MIAARYTYKTCVNSKGVTGKNFLLLDPTAEQNQLCGLGWIWVLSVGGESKEEQGETRRMGESVRAALQMHS